MALKAVLDTLDTLPEEIRPVAETFFKQGTDGKFVIDIEGLTDHPDVAKLARGIEHERRERATAIKAKQELEQRLREFEERATKGSVEPSAEQSGVNERLKREYDDRIKAIEAKLNAAEEQRQAAEGRLAETRIADALRAAALDAGVSRESVEDLISLPRFRSPWKMTETGDPAPFDGDLPRIDPDKPSAPMSAKAYVREFLKENKQWLPPSSGSGAPGAQRATGAGAFTLTAEQAKDVRTYRAAREAAAKVGQDVVIVG